MKMKSKITLATLVVALSIGLALWLRKGPSLAPMQPVASAKQTPTGAPDTALAPPAPIVSQPAVTSSGTSSRRKFAQMGVLEENAILREIAKQDLPTIFQAMLDAERVEHDPRKQMHLQSILAGALREKTPTPEFLQQMRTFLRISSNSNFERQLLIGALESAATKETVDLLLQIAASSTEEKIKESAGSLAGVGDLGRGAAELSPMLERAWRDSGDPNLLFSVASTMARIGTPSGIDLLLSAALAPNEQNKARGKAAQSALREVYLSNAVPALAARLLDQPPTSETARLVAPILVKIGDAAAAGAVVTWLQERDENAAAFVRDLIVQRTVNPTMLAAWEAALDPAVQFSNEQNREAVRAGVAAYYAGRTTQP